MGSEKTYAEQAPGATGVDPNHPAAARPEILDHDSAIVRVSPLRRKFAICGFAASTRGLAPFADQEYEVWGMNQLYRHIPRADRWFDIHENWAEDNVEGTDHPGWLAKCGIPVYMTSRQPSIPTSVRYPLEAIMREVTGGLDYFTSSVSFMLGIALWEIERQVQEELASIPESDLPRDPKAWTALTRRLYAEREIAIFGIDLIVGTEYDYQKACVEYLLGISQAKNITLRIPPQSALLKQLWRYGYEKEPKGWPIRISELQKRQTAIQEERNKLIARLNTLDGAAQENGYWQQVHDLRSKGGTVKLNEDT